MANNGREQKRGVPRPPPLSLFIAKEQEEVVSTTPRMTRTNSVIGSSNNKKRTLSKQLSMKETTREVKWEKRRRQIQRQRSNMSDAADHVCTVHANAKGVTDEDLDELKGSMELGFGFNEENGGQNLCDTLPALDLYFAVNRQFSNPKMWASSSNKSLPSLSLPTRSTSTFSATSSPAGSPTAQPSLLDSLQICSPGENPKLMKTRLRQWAQVVACSVKHSS
ncbi:uncharacterized protein LOC100835369 [Brachypodium distachyon]|uniref:Uncharacterized protein n=1 Tax=Brachypodium distachyon TaxID=15368 RepID=I1IWM6_BRADI|nr:uncharacterized protein LOC100835369 [Brachypodium distachyon]KQJ82036.1 hypothetical protein BRADI_5g05120v3 [Brachypodium distachyon]|eukprot:XP_003579539.1 uncharacterized protein LOC100835369 [Brachypodium distachyon]